MERSISIPDERERAWKRLLEKSAPIEIKSVNIIESDVFAPQKIELRRVLAFIGLHGTGKTLLLRMLEAAFGYIDQIDVPPFISGTQSPLIVDGKRIGIDPSAVSGILELEIKTPHGLIARRVDLSEPDASRRGIWTEALGDSFAACGISPLYLFAELQATFQDYGTLLRNIENDEGKDLPKGKLRAVGNILGRPYDRITVYSANLKSSSSAMYVPHIAAFLGDRVFDGSMMSQGELWVHYVLSWFLEMEVSKGDLALLDEPEAFIAARAQRPFIDQVARQALEKDLQLIISTHSPEVLARFPIENIRMCIFGANGIQVIEPSSTVQIRETIGLETPIRMLVLVEDDLASEILHSLLARFDRALTREVEIIPVDGEGEVVNGLRVLKHLEKLTCLGVLDGDKRGREIKASHPLFFLPGATFPENELLSAASREAAWTAESMGVGHKDLLVAISSCRGLEHQYWLKTLARHLGLTESVIAHELIRAWMRDESIKQEAENLVSNIRSAFPSRRKF